MPLVERAQKNSVSPVRRRVSEDGSCVDLYADVERNRAPPSSRPAKSSFEKSVSSPLRGTELQLRAPKETTRAEPVDLSFSFNDLDVGRFTSSFSEGLEYEVPLDPSESSDEGYNSRKSSHSPVNETSDASQRMRSPLNDSPASCPRGRAYTESELRDRKGRSHDSKSPKRSKSNSSRSGSTFQSRHALATSTKLNSSGVEGKADSCRDRSRSDSRSRPRSTSTGGQASSSSHRRYKNNEQSLSPVRHSSIESTNSGSAYSHDRHSSSKHSRTAATVWSPDMGYKSKTNHSSRSSDGPASRGSAGAHSSRQRSASVGRSTGQRDKKKRLEEKKQKAREKIASQMTTRTWRAQLAEKFGRTSAGPSGITKRYRVPSTLVCNGNFDDDIPDDLTAI